jgi:hypothetical protein
MKNKKNTYSSPAFSIITEQLLLIRSSIKAEQNLAKRNVAYLQNAKREIESLMRGAA